MQKTCGYCKRLDPRIALRTPSSEHDKNVFLYILDDRILVTQYAIQFILMK